MEIQSDSILYVFQRKNVQHSYPQPVLPASEKTSAAEDSQDKVELSAAGKELLNSYLQSVEASAPQSINAVSTMDDDKTGPSEQFSEDEKKQIAELKARDREVHVHEQAHLSAAGGLARGGANFTYAVGPDGRRYATGGEVSIDTSSVPDDPQATIQKMNTVRKAALAPMNPSATDRSVAAKASATAAKAQGELMQKIGTTKQNGTNDEENMTKYQQQRGFAIYENAI